MPRKFSKFFAGPSRRRVAKIGASELLVTDLDPDSVKIRQEKKFLEMRKSQTYAQGCGKGNKSATNKYRISETKMETEAVPAQVPSGYSPQMRGIKMENFTQTA